MRSTQEAAARSRSLPHCGSHIGGQNFHQSDSRDEVVVGGARQSITEKAYAAVGVLKSRGRFDRVRRLITELNISSYVYYGAARGQEIGAELQQLISPPLRQIALRLPSRTKVAARETRNCGNERNDELHRADVSRVNLFKEFQSTKS